MSRIGYYTFVIKVSCVTKYTVRPLSPVRIIKCNKIRANKVMKITNYMLIMINELVCQLFT